MKKEKTDNSIKQALRDMPALIMKEKEDTQHDEKKQTLAPMYHSSPEHRRWLTIGVVIFASFIFIVWILSFSDLFFVQKQETDPSEQLWSQSKQDISNILTTFGQEELDNTKEIISETTQDKPEQKISQTLGALFESIHSSSTASSSISTTTN